MLDDRGYDASRVVLEALPRLHRRNLLMPAYEYQRGAGQLGSNGAPKDDESLPPKVVQRVAGREQLLAGQRTYARRAARALEDLGSFL